MSNYLSTVTIGDFVGPEFLAAMSIIEDDADYLPQFLSEEQLRWTMGTAMSQSDIWDKLWRFGIIVDDDMNYYMPSDYDTEVSFITLDTPPSEVA